MNALGRLLRLAIDPEFVEDDRPGDDGEEQEEEEDALTTSPALRTRLAMPVSDAGPWARMTGTGNTRSNSFQAEELC